MRVQFEFTVDDLVDVQLRALKRSRAARGWLWRERVGISLVSGVILFAIIPGETTSRLIVGLIGILLGAALFPMVNESIVKGRLRKLFQEDAGPGNVFICEVELNESGVHVKQNGMEIIYRWPDVKEVRDTGDTVDIHPEKKGGLVVVRKQAFNGPAERQQFVELATDYLKKARASAQSN